MRKLYISLLALALAGAVFSCNKREPQNLQPTFNGTNAVEGEWEMWIYKGDTVKKPMAATLIFDATSDTSGTASFDMTTDGLSNNVEHTVYDLKINEKTIYFSRTLGGNSGILVHGEKWKIERMILHDDERPDTFGMRSDITGERMYFSKP
jgi:hypothetical protein